MTLLIRNQNVRGRKALKKGQSLILCTVRNVSGQRYATSLIVSVNRALTADLPKRLLLKKANPAQNIFIVVQKEHRCDVCFDLYLTHIKEHRTLGSQNFVLYGT